MTFKKQRLVQFSLYPCVFSSASVFRLSPVTCRFPTAKRTTQSLFLAAYNPNFPEHPTLVMNDFITLLSSPLEDRNSVSYLREQFAWSGASRAPRRLLDVDLRLVAQTGHFYASSKNGFNASNQRHICIFSI